MTCLCLRENPLNSIGHLGSLTHHLQVTDWWTGGLLSRKGQEKINGHISFFQYYKSEGSKSAGYLQDVTPKEIWFGTWTHVCRLTGLEGVCKFLF